MYKYETHLHTSPVSRCAVASVEDTINFYADQGYDGVFITNHFINGNINFEKGTEYKDALDYYFSDYDKGVELGAELGIKVFLGIETTYGGTDFLVYGLDKQWYYDHPEILKMPTSHMLELMMDSGALVVQAHPFREAGYIDHIRLFPRAIHGVEIINASRSEFENEMANLFAQKYDLLKFAGSDNHSGANAQKLAGVSFKEPISDACDFVQRAKAGEAEIFFVTNKKD